MSSELAVQQPSAMDLLQRAVDHGAGIETIERLARLQREMAEYQAQLEFNDAMQRAQARMRRVGFDKRNPQTNSAYTSYTKLDAALRPIYSDEGFSLSFDTAESAPDTVLVLCYVSRGGYTRTYRIQMPADGKGPKGNDVMTRTHATGSAMKYGQRYLLKAIFNVTEGERDDDGNAAAGDLQGEMPIAEFDSWKLKIEAATSETLYQTFKDATLAARRIGDKAAERQFTSFKDDRKQELAR